VARLAAAITRHGMSSNAEIRGAGGLIACVRVERRVMPVFD